MLRISLKLRDEERRVRLERERRRLDLRETNSIYF